MRPTLAAEELKTNLTQYLSTTFALADPPVREALEKFLNHPANGIFRGPYLRIRTPFRPADEDWRDILEWAPDEPVPYLHQVQAWRRLSSLDREPQPTLVTTGTGSGKTEAFLIPVLDHCRRAKQAGRRGVKAVLLYPMNALATDQAMRINDLLTRPELKDVTAGLYIGEAPDTTYSRVLTERSEIRSQRPDILITNYKMLDLLLQRGEDLALWQDADIAYVVVDEFHTYDGAQGTDVAMLLRRLAAATNHSQPGKPLGKHLPGRDIRHAGRGRERGTHPGGRRAGLRHRVRRELGDHRAAAACRGVPRRDRLLAAPPGAAGTRGAGRPARGRPGDGGDRQARHRPGDHRPGGARAGAADSHPHARADGRAR